MRSISKRMWIMAGLLWLGMVAGPALNADVGLWLFDEGADVTAFDQGGDADMDMTLRNGATWTTDTPFIYPGNHALLLDGVNDYARPGFTGSQKTWLQSNQDFSVEAHIKTSTLTGTYQFIAGARIDHGYYLGLTPVGEAFFFVRDSSGDSATVGPVMTDGAWHHLAGVYDATLGMTLYVDGSPVDTDVARTGTTSYAGQYWAVGSRSLVADQWVSGAIDEVRLVDRALSPAEVLFDSQNSLVPEPYTALLLGFGALGLLTVRKKG